MEGKKEKTLSESLETLAASFVKLREELHRINPGQEEEVDRVLEALLNDHRGIKQLQMGTFYSSGTMPG